MLLQCIPFTLSNKNGNYAYFEHNEMLSENEIECVKLVAIKLSDLACQIEKELSSLINNLTKP